MTSNRQENLDKAEKWKADGIGSIHFLRKHKIPKLTREDIEILIYQSHKRKRKGSKISDP